MMNNLTQIAQLLKGRNPQAVVLEMLTNGRINDPRIKDLINFAQKGDINSVLNLASPLFAERGYNLNDELTSFMQLIG